MQRNFFQRLYPPTYLLISLVLMFLLHRYYGMATVLAWPWRLIGLLPLLGGFALNMYCALLFHRGKTSIKPFEESATLITSGPYRWSRNPIYLGVFLITIGFALFLGTATPLVVPLLLALLLQAQFIEPEEKMLAERFGDDYAAYCARVRRWF